MKQKIKRNYILNLLHQIFLITVPLVVTPYVAHILGPEGLGKFSFAYTLVSYFVIVLSLGFNYYGQREIAKCQNDIRQQSKIFYEILFLRLTIFIFELLIILVLSFLGVYGKYTTLMIIFSFELVVAASDITFFFQGKEEFIKVVAINLIFKILSIIGIFVLVKSHNDIYIYAFLNSGFFILESLFKWLFLRGKLVKVKLRELNLLQCFKKSMILFIPIIALNLYRLINKSLIGLITQSDFENGIYSQVEKLIFHLIILIKSLNIVMLSRNTSEISQGNIEQVKENNYNAVHFVWLIGLPLVIGIICVAGNFIPWFLGDSFDKSILLLQVMSLVLILICISSVIGEQYLLPNKKDRCYNVSILIGVAVNLIVSIPLIYYFGALGAGIAMVLSEFSILIVMLCMVAKELSMKRIFKLMFKPFIASLIMGTVIWPLTVWLVPSFFSTLIIFASGLFVYMSAILLLRDHLVLNVFKIFRGKRIVKTESNTFLSENKTLEKN